MASRYEFTEGQIEEMMKAAKENKEKDVDKRLRTLLMRANGKKLSEIAAATGYSFSGIVKLGLVLKMIKLCATSTKWQ